MTLDPLHISERMRTTRRSVVEQHIVGEIAEIADALIRMMEDGVPDTAGLSVLPEHPNGLVTIAAVWEEAE